MNDPIMIAALGMTAVGTVCGIASLVIEIHQSHKRTVAKLKAENEQLRLALRGAKCESALAHADNVRNIRSAQRLRQIPSLIAAELGRDELPSLLRQQAE